MDDRKDIHQPGRVAMRPACEWTCDECGKDNFERCVDAGEHMTREDIRQTLIAAGELDEWQDLPEGIAGNWTTYPESVTCQHCGSEFGTENFDAMPEDDEC